MWIILDTAAFEAHVQRFRLGFDKAMKEEAERYPYEMQAAIGGQFRFQEVPETQFAPDSPLSIGKGALSRALIPNKPGNITKIVAKDGYYEPEYGIDTDAIPYALVQEYGAKGGKIFSKGKMPWYFFHRAAETGIDKYRIIGASILKREKEEGVGYVKAEARPYWRPGQQEYEQRFWPKKLKRIENNFTALWKAAESG